MKPLYLSPYVNKADELELGELKQCFPIIEKGIANGTCSAQVYALLEKFNEVKGNVSAEELIQHLEDHRQDVIMYQAIGLCPLNVFINEDDGKNSAESSVFSSCSFEKNMNVDGSSAGVYIAIREIIQQDGHLHEQLRTLADGISRSDDKKCFQ